MKQREIKMPKPIKVKLTAGTEKSSNGARRELTPEQMKFAKFLRG
jgi:hypothetical protein